MSRHTPAGRISFCLSATFFDVGITAVGVDAVKVPLFQAHSSAYEVPLPTLLTLPCVSSDACAFVPEALGLLLLADLLAASICCFVCWCIVRAYEESEYVESPSNSGVGIRLEDEEDGYAAEDDIVNRGYAGRWLVCDCEVR